MESGAAATISGAHPAGKEGDFVVAGAGFG